MFGDMKQVNDSDLRFSPSRVAPQDNALTELAKIKVSLEESDNSFIQKSLEGKTWDAARAERLVNSGKADFRHLKAAVKMPIYQNPSVLSPGQDMKGPNMLAWKHVAQLMLLDSLLLEKRGQSKEAMNESFLLLELGSKFQSGEITYINYLVGTDIKMRAYDRMRQIASRSKFSARDYRGYLSRLDMGDGGRGLASRVKVEYAASARMFGGEGLSKGAGRKVVENPQ